MHHRACRTTLDLDAPCFARPYLTKPAVPHHALTIRTKTCQVGPRLPSPAVHYLAVTRRSEPNTTPTNRNLPCLPYRDITNDTQTNPTGTDLNTPARTSPTVRTLPRHARPEHACLDFQLIHAKLSVFLGTPLADADPKAAKVDHVQNLFERVLAIAVELET